MEAKVKINLKEGLIELEGSETFVSKYLEIFRKEIADNKFGNQHEGSVPPQQDAKPPGQQETINKKTPAKKGKPAKTKNISPEKFDVHKDGESPPLKEFYDQKAPGSATGDRIAVIGYYIQHIKKQNHFTEGNVDYAYRMLKLTGRPKHLHQIMINNKNQRDLFEQLEGDGQWRMTRTGEIFVEEELPEK